VTIDMAGLIANNVSLEALGIEPSELYIWKVLPGSPAAKAGFQAKDRIVNVDGNDIHAWNDFLVRVKNYVAGSAPIQVTVLHDGVPRKMEVSPELTESMNAKGQEEKRFTIGVVSGSIKIVSELTMLKARTIGDIVTRGLRQTVEISEFMVMSIVRIVQGKISAKNIGGVITIGRIASRSFEVGLSAFLKMMGLISINLFMINLLPIPVLDGGHLLFFSVEAVRGTPISLRKMEIAQQVGLTLLIMLMAFALFNDVNNLFTARW
jgi:regulator of sigma E protease